MKPIYPVYLFIAVLLYSACKKEGGATPAKKEPAYTVYESSPLNIYVPHTDTFYGMMVQQGDFYIDTPTYIYVTYQAPDSLKYSSPFTASSYYCHNCIAVGGAFAIDSANYYHAGRDINTVGLRITTDSLIYGGGFGDCDDYNSLNFKGIKVSKPH